VSFIPSGAQIFFETPRVECGASAVREERVAEEAGAEIRVHPSRSRKDVERGAVEVVVEVGRGVAVLVGRIVGIGDGRRQTGGVGSQVEGRDPRSVERRHRYLGQEVLDGLV
jgi:hypothetical protein